MRISEFCFDRAIEFNQLIARQNQKITFVDGPEDPPFNFFSQLLSEIRLAIWRLALPLPRLIPSVSEEEDYDDIIHYGPWSKSSDRYKRSRRKARPTSMLEADSTAYFTHAKNPARKL
jgi:hypothetical protein